MISGERMKRGTTVMAVLAISALGFAHNGVAQSNPSAAPQNPPAGQASAQTTAPAKRPPQAKSQPEFDAYKAIIATTDPAAQEKAANDFATKYPESELRPLVYKSVMRSYQQANNGEKMLEMAQKALSYDPDDPEALVAVAQVLAERTHDTDLDRDQKLAEARKDAQRALVTVDTDVPTAGYPPEQLQAFKNFLRSDAYDVLGTLDFNAKSWPDAEANLKKSIDAYPQQVDPVVVLRLSLTLDQENRYPDALKYAEQAVSLTKEGTASGDAARKEKDRLTQLTGGATPAPK
jgi:tetratricopeptide (TPR) repeat protein